jgi:hypothetical protein
VLRLGWRIAVQHGGGAKELDRLGGLRAAAAASRA